MADRFDEKIFLDYVEDELDRQQKDQFESQIAEDPQLRRLVTQVFHHLTLLDAGIGRRFTRVGQLLAKGGRLVVTI